MAAGSTPRPRSTARYSTPGTRRPYRGTRRARARTGKPACRSSSTTRRPRRPVPPVTNTPACAATRGASVASRAVRRLTCCLVGCLLRLIERNADGFADLDRVQDRPGRERRRTTLGDAAVEAADEGDEAGIRRRATEEEPGDPARRAGNPLQRASVRGEEHARACARPEDPRDGARDVVGSKPAIGADNVLVVLHGPAVQSDHQNACGVPEANQGIDVPVGPHVHPGKLEGQHRRAWCRPAIAARGGRPRVEGCPWPARPE